MKKNVIEGVIITIMVLIIIGIISFISFYFVGSYDTFDESVGMKYCKVVANESGSKVTTVLNDFMYDTKKYYSCVIGETIPKIYVIDSEGKVVLYKNYTKYSTIAEGLEGSVSYGLYEDKLVVVQKIINEDSLDIYYYDENGTCIFDLKGMDSDE